MNFRFFPFRILLPIAAILGIGVFAVSFLAFPEVRAFEPTNGAKDASLDASIVIRFSKPVNRTSLAPLIQPDIEGEWRYEDPAFGGRHLYRTLRFVPDTVLRPETTYTVRVGNVTDIFALGPERTFAAAFSTQTLPTVSHVTPENGLTAVSPASAITVSLSTPNPDLVDIGFSLEPNVPVKVTRSDALDAYTLTPTEPLAQGTEYHLTVGRSLTVLDRQTREVVFRGESEVVSTTKFTTLPPASVAALAPTGDHVPVGEILAVTFNAPMALEELRQGFSVSPAVPGELTLSSDGLTATFVPEQVLAYDTAYTVRIAQGTKTSAGAFLPADAAFAFTTIGPVRVSQLSPPNGAAGVDPASAIRITFDQETDHGSAQEHVTFAPSLTGAYSWDGDTLVFRPGAKLAHSAKYTVTVGSGVKSIHGQESVQEFSTTFTTAAETVKLAVASDLQDKALSCEAASLKMALAAKGVRVTEDAIMAKVGFDPTPHKGKTWGDPQVAFVGSITGRQNTTGYGVYWGPIAKAANAWRPSEAFTGWTVPQLASEIAQGNAVVVWGIFGSGYEDSWVTPSGKYIYAWKGEHTRTVIGFVGSAENPTKIILNDPNAGQITWSRERFESDWKIFGNAGVVVR